MTPQAGPSTTTTKTTDAHAPAARRAASPASRSAAAAGATPASLAHQPLGEFLNRELSWLEFNRRVLHEALDERTPLLERVAFLAIFTSNLDEWYQKRVGGMKRQIAAGVQTRSVDGLSAEEQIKVIRDAILPMIKTQAEAYLSQIKPALAEQGIHLMAWDELSESQRRTARDYFHRNLFPVLTPLSVDPGHPFPFISNLSTSLGVLLRHPHEQEAAIEPEADDTGTRFARVKVPAVLPRWVPLESDETAGQFRFVALEDIIRHHLDQLFEGMTIEEVEPFRVTRNADVERDEEDAEDLLDLIEQELRDRRFAKVVRLETDDSPSLPINQFLIRELGLYPEDVYEMPGLLDYTPLFAVNNINRPDLKHRAWTPVVPARLADEDASIFSIIRQGDVMVHHPYESFAGSVERFIRTAARDPDVVAIKLTLYRTAADSPFIPDLIKAAEAGKQVVVLVELKARFDEQRNVHLAQQLEKHGIHVVYGLVGYKTHTKTSLVVRRETDAMRCYAHVGTGNYHSKTANLYTDLGLLTADPRITNDLVELFHYLTGRAVKKDFKHLLIAPINMRRRFEAMIDREIEHASAWRSRGGKADDPDRPRIIAKMNSLEDKKLIRRLYEASNAGVKIDLIVRGFCVLRPGVPGMSENITVTSVIGRFLEHSRIYCFHNRGKPEYYIGSADWMYRNLNNRVEAITPIYDPAHQQRLRHILEVCLADHRQAWDMHGDGNYTQRTVPDDADPKSPAALGTHQTLMTLARQRAAAEAE